METITPEEMAIADENSEYLGVPRTLLMENAGAAVARLVKAKIPSLAGKRVVVVAGLGNNGGDGFVAARHLAGEGASVLVILLGSPGEIRTEEARLNWRALERMLLHIRLFTAPAPSLAEVARSIEEADVVIDAIFGTGVKGRIGEPFSTAIDAVNKCRGLRLAVDIPSGVDPSTGSVQDRCVTAHATVTFHRPKPGLLRNPGTVGELVVAPIGVPPEAETVAGPGDVRAVVKPRSPESKKGDFGRLLVVGGGPGYSGAPAFAALTALRTGVDLAFVAAPRSVSEAIRGYSPNLIVRRLSSDYLVPEDLPLLADLASKSTSIVVGPGLGLEEETRRAVLEFMRGVNIPMLVDADAVKALREEPAMLRGRPAVLTPHAGEFAVMSGLQLPGGEALWERVEMVKEVAGMMGVTVLLKAHVDIVSDGDRFKVNATGNPGMTVGGTGDVLSGVAGAFLGWGAQPFRAACAAAFVSGAAGDMAAGEKGFHIVATDVIEKIPEVLKRFDRAS